MKKNRIYNIIAILLLIIFIVGCASIGSPQGGRKDEEPPRIIETSPRENATNFNGKKVEIKFDELVSLVNTSEKVIISPVMDVPPVVTASMDKIVVKFQEDLKPNTTYTIDFTDAIVDYNEKNKFGNYSFSFSTGKSLDSLKLSGFLLDSYNLNPINNKTIAAYDNLNDSSFTKIKFEKFSKSGQNGYFSIKGLKDLDYRIYGINDVDKSYKYDSPTKGIAFNDSIYHPYTQPGLAYDTVWLDSTTVDSVITSPITLYKPDSLVLLYFEPTFKRQYLATRKRPTRNKLYFTFGASADSLPKIKLINSDNKDWYVLEKSLTNDTLTYWLKDSSVIQMDTLLLSLTYLHRDSLDELVPKIDTVKLTSYRRSKPKKQGNSLLNSFNKKEKEIKVKHLGFSANFENCKNIYSVPSIKWEEPLKINPDSAYHFYKKVDTLWVEEPFKLVKDSCNIRYFYFDINLEYGAQYKFRLDSARVKSFYDLTNNKIEETFTIRKHEDYSKLIVNLKNEPDNFILQVLRSDEDIIKSKRVVNHKVIIDNVVPGRYYLKGFFDVNNNGKWDTGNFEEKRMPERVYYRKQTVDLRANWDVIEDWDVNELPIFEQKPDKLKKIKK